MSMFNAIDLTGQGNEVKCISNSEEVKMYAKRFPQGHWTFLGPGDEKKWYGNRSYKLEGKWKFIASKMVQRSEETGHRILTSARALSRGILKRLKFKRRHTSQSDASDTEHLFRIIHSVNQLRIYGAVSIWSGQHGQSPNGTVPTLERFTTTEDSVNQEILKSVNA